MTSISPMLLDGLLVLDLLLLAATLWLAGRLLARARVESPSEIAEEEDGDFASRNAFVSERNWFAEQPSEASVLDAPVLETPRPARIEAVPDPPPAPRVPFASQIEPSESPEPEPLQFREMGTAADLFADPLDGTLFLDGEEIFVCRCGVGYHAETWEWIRAQHQEKCVHCGAQNNVEKRTVPPRE